ncbi:galactokinase [Actinospica sp.]|jgi:galactokinase|uniref:galactokinase n=1 Tax=Actinospica sp. TaxID=1872142 RepID=UPI002C016C46|nr:galactokinase [Actinospica sp.]HWG23538.1 galactokinase [Actinospica sp.]
MSIAAQEAAEAARKMFEAVYGAVPTGIFAAPGRVNVIGEHTDYNEGFVLPMAIDRYTAVAAAPRLDGLLRMVSGQGETGVLEIPVASLIPGERTGWADYPAGVAWAMIGAGALPADFKGADLAFSSRVPVGSGLSSSAALECSTGLALAALSGKPISPAELARLSQYAENAYAHVPCGPLDQLSSAFGAADAVLHIDTRTFDIAIHPFALGEAGLALLVMNTKVQHQHGESGYADRRAACERAARLMGVPALRDLSFADLERAATVLDEADLRRVRHVVTENDRVNRFVSLLQLGPLEGPRLNSAGELLTASHISLRDDFEVSCAELDIVVDAALRGGAHGARMTGGGFGGCAIALVSTERLERVAETVSEALPQAELFTVVADRGAYQVA